MGSPRTGTVSAWGSVAISNQSRNRGIYETSSRHWMKTKTYPRPTIHVSFGGTGLHGRNSGYAGYIRLSKRALSSTVSQSDAILNPPKRLVPLSDAFLAQSVSMNLLDCGWKTGLRCIFCTGTGACQARRFPFWHAVGGCGFNDEARLRQNWRRSARSAPPPACRTTRPRHRTGRRLYGLWVLLQRETESLFRGA